MKNGPQKDFHLMVIGMKKSKYNEERSDQSRPGLRSLKSREHSE